MVDKTNKEKMEKAGKGERPLIQPLAVAIVCAVFIILILIMGMLDLQRLDRTLVGFLEDRALGITGVVQRLAQENLSNLVEASRREKTQPSTGLDQPYSPQKLLISALVEIGREVDNRWKADRLSEEYLRRYADEKRVLVIAVLDKQGRLVFMSRDLPDDYWDDGIAPHPGRGELTIDMLQKWGATGKIGFVALKRRDGSGTVIVALDPEGLRFWGIKVSIDKAISELGEGKGQGLSYFMVLDLKERVVAQSGQVPEPWSPGEMETGEILAGRRAVTSRKVVYLERQILDVAAPLVLNGQLAGIFRLGLDREGAEKILADNRQNVFIYMGLTILIALLSLWLLYTNQNRHLAGIVAMERRLEKAERLSALGQLAAGVAHEIRNPLNAISMATQRLQRDYVLKGGGQDEEFARLVTVIRDEIRRLNGIIEEFLTFSRSRRLDLREFPLVEVLQKIVSLVTEEAETRGIRLETSWPAASPVIPMDVDKLQQAFLNFIKNAMESMDGGGRVSLEVAEARGGWVSVRIADTGCGMTEEEVERIFSPEYTTKEKGLGLGLPLAHEIIRGHGGEIRVSSRKGEGTVFEILLPGKA
ncbi:MAG TPA: ATP-binding protein [Syntrophales bacterium]|nr:ATP-binding protein [Syntrophales bacterium]HPC01071.1 ATP-binding protein [Syntrophales bacterium]